MTRNEYRRRFAPIQLMPVPLKDYGPCTIAGTLSSVESAVAYANRLYLTKGAEHVLMKQGNEIIGKARLSKKGKPIGDMADGRIVHIR